jgi:CheY-like chemotaxis protein
MTATILVVEDNPIARKLVRFALENQGFTVVAAADAKAALREFTEHEVTLVLQDLMLPDMDGFDLVKRLRALPGGAEIPILAVSGMLSKLEAARLSEVGFNDVINKPVEPSRLLQIIRGHLPPPESEAADRFGAGKRLVVADDDAVQRKLAAFRLENLGFEVTQAGDGLEALEKARTERPDALVSDILMPRLDGFALCMEVRRDPDLAALPVVLMTNSYVESADQDLARRAGANDMVLRTPDLQDVIASLRASLEGTSRTPRTATAQLDEDVERERMRRITKQLERQVALNAGIARRCTLLSAELSVLSAISDALATRHDFDSALEEVLAACFDAGGISLGALYLRREEGFEVVSFGAASGWRRDQLETFFGDLPLLEEAMASEAVLEIPSEAVAEERGRALLERAAMTRRENADSAPSSVSSLASALIAPLRYKGRALGALLMVSRTSELRSEDRTLFAQAVAGQISQALALAEAFAASDAAEQAATAHAAVLGSILESIADGVVVADAGGKLIHWNPAAEQITGKGPPATAMDFGDNYGLLRSDRVTPVSPEEIPLIRAINGESVDWVEMFAGYDDAGENRWLSINARPLRDQHGQVTGGVTVFRDVSAEKAAQTQLMVSDRMASIGMLAAGVAHEINNPLAAVLANLELAAGEVEGLRGKLGGAAELEELVDELKDARIAADRVRLIVRDLKLFSRSEDDKRSAVDVRRVLDSSIRMAWNEIRHRARLVREYGEVPRVNANESRLGQVFLNLIVNAAQAIPEGQANRHQIRVTTGVDGESRVCIDIADTGEGMPPEVLARLFTPFFTTKPAGVGTGLGLTICQRLVTAIGGAIHAESQVGKGSVFHVTLPMTAAEASELAEPVAPVGPAARRGKVLVVDDERAIGTAIARTLGREHEVLHIAAATEALSRIAEGDHFDVILCDLMMPVMTGMDLHRELSHVAPEQAERMIFLTGGAFTPKARAFLDSVPNQRIEKPFDIRTLRSIISDRIR